MSLLKEPGTYLAKPETTAVEQKDSGAVQFSGVFLCKASRNGGDWQPLDGEQRITAFLNLVTKKGAINEINVRSLKDSLGWDGASFATLQREDWNGTECQLVVDEETYDNKTSLRVQYINPTDYKPGGTEKADAQVIQSLDAKYGSMLRALGGKNGGAVAGKPASVPAGMGATTVGKDLAWASFTHKVDEYAADPKNADDPYTNERRISVFRKIVGTAAEGKDTKSLTAGDWAKIKKQIDDSFDPAIEGFIPF